MNELSHEEPKSQTVAGIFHVGFALLYIIAALWHLNGSKEHFSASRKEKQ